LFQSNLVKSSEIERHEEKPYILDIHPKHYFNNNQLFIKLEPQPLNANALIKQLDEKHFEKPKGILPDFAISRYDLPAMFLLAYLMKQTNNKNLTIENRLKQWKANIKRCFNAIKEETLKPVANSTLIKANSSLVNANESEIANYQIEFERRKQLLDKQLEQYKITSTDLPKFFRDYLLNIAPPNLHQKAKAIIKKLIEETQNLLERTEKQISQKKKAGKRGSKIIESGKLADYLARDMMQFQQPLEGVKNDGLANSTQFQVLQSSMAFWGREQDKLPAIFNQLNLSQQHPFLNNVSIDDAGVYTFFKSYFKEKEQYLNEVLEKIANNTAKTEDYYFINLKERSNLKERANNLIKEQPMQLPGDFFHRQMLKHIEQHLPAFYTVLGANEGKPKLNYVIHQYFAHNHQDEAPTLYNQKRNYRTYDQWLDKRNRKTQRNSLEPEYLSVKERSQIYENIKAELKDKKEEVTFKRGLAEKTKSQWLRGTKNINKNESQLWNIKTEDIILYLAAMQIFKGELPSLQLSDDVKLKNLSIKDESSLLENVIDFELPYTFKDENGAEKTIDITDRMKMKDYGKFRRFLRDRRLPNLMAYYTTAKISKTALIDELHVYETKRIEVLQAIYEFEKAAYQKFESHFKPIREQDSGGIISHNLYLMHLVDKNIIDAAKEKTMNEFRNRFSHNEYPLISIGALYIDENKETEIANQLADVAIKLYKNTMKKMMKRS